MPSDCVADPGIAQDWPQQFRRMASKSPSRPCPVAVDLDGFRALVNDRALDPMTHRSPGPGEELIYCEDNALQMIARRRVMRR